MAHMYDVGTKAWQPDQTEGWVASEVTEKNIDGDKVTLVFTLENEEVCHASTAQQHAVLTATDQNRRDDPLRHGGGGQHERVDLTAPDEPCNARSQ